MTPHHHIFGYPPCRIFPFPRGQLRPPGPLGGCSTGTESSSRPSVGLPRRSAHYSQKETSAWDLCRTSESSKAHIKISTEEPALYCKNAKCQQKVLGNFACQSIVSVLFEATPFGKFMNDVKNI